MKNSIGVVIVLALVISMSSQAELSYRTAWLRQIGSNGNDYSCGVAVDSSGNVYISGYTNGNLVEGSDVKLNDVFLTKYDAQGNILWSQQIGTDKNDYSKSITTDAAGNIYLSGYTDGSFNEPNSGLNDAFLIKYDTAGNKLWSRQIGTTQQDYSRSVATDDSGNIYISGNTYGAIDGTNNGDTDAFLTKYGPDGTVLWSRQIGTTNSDSSFSVAVDGFGNAYISGYTFGSIQEGIYFGNYDIFITKYRQDGTFLWSRQIGTTNFDGSYSVAIDISGNAYISGYTAGSLLDGTNMGLNDAFLTKYDSDGNRLWTREIGSSGSDSSFSVAVDDDGNAYISGYTNGNFEGTNAGSYDAFLTKYSTAGNLLWSRQIGTASEDRSLSVAVADSDGVYISGYTNGNMGSTNFGGYDAFLIKFLPRIPGDANDDGKVDVSDLGILAAHYGATSGATWEMGDFNEDEAVDVSDLGILAGHYGTGSGEALDFEQDARALGLDVNDEVAAKAETESLGGCSAVGLPMIAIAFLAGLTLLNCSKFRAE